MTARGMFAGLTAEQVTARIAELQARVRVAAWASILGGNLRAVAARKLGIAP